MSEIMESLGTRSFGSFLMLAGLIVVMPLIGDIPGVPTLVGVIVALVSIQLLLGRKQFWLPQTMLKRSIEKARLDRELQRTDRPVSRSEEHTSELQSLMRISYAVFCLKKTNK